MLKESQRELPNNISALKNIISTITSKNSFLENRNEFLHEEIKLLRLRLYAKLSERFTDDIEDIQRSLFEELISEIEELIPEEKPLVIKEHVRNKSGRKKLPEELDRVEIEHDISNEEKLCKCGTLKSRIGEAVAEKLQIEPAKLWVEKHIRPKYACKACEGVVMMGRQSVLLQ